MKQLLDVLLTDLEPDPEQPRKDFEPEALNELALSIQAVGVIQAITIRNNPHGSTKYMIIAGERRWRASKIAGKETIPAVLLSKVDPNVVYQQQLTENLHREGLNPVEKAEFIERRLGELRSLGVGSPIEEISKELGVSPSWVSKNTAVLRFAADLREVVRDGRLREYAVLKKLDKLPSEKRQSALDLIKNGQFNAKTFFARKRYDKPQVDAKDDMVNGSEENGTEKPVKNKAFVAKLSLKRDAFVKLVQATDYGNIASSVNPLWTEMSDDELHSLSKSFVDWIEKS